jgi:hypothetical protein
MSECFGGDTCTYGSYDPWDDYDPWGNWNDNDSPYYPDYPDEGSGGGPSSEPAPTPTPIDPHTVQDAIAGLTQLQVALKEILTKGLNSIQIAKVNKIIEGVNFAIAALNSGDQITDHTTFSEVVSEALAFAAAILIGSAAAAMGLPAVIGVIAGGLASYAVEKLANEAFDTMGDLYSEFQEAIPPRWEDEIICRISKFCDLQIPPIVLDMDGDGVELLAKGESPARMDIDGDGFYERISWVKGDDALLYIDHNNSGIIDQNNEFSFASFAGRGATDLEGLRTFDTNQDNVFDSKDEAFSQAGVWQDVNENATQEAGEMKTLTEVGITSISMAGDNAMQVTKDSVIANNMTYTVTSADGSQVTKAAGDVLFYGNRKTGIKKHMLDNDNAVVEHENGKVTLDLANTSSDQELNIGDDEFAGFISFNRVITGTGNDVITVSGTTGIQIQTGKGKDTVHGSDGNDQIRGGKGNDSLFGGQGNDSIRGGRGKDTLDGGQGNDLLKGGKGADTFIVGQGHDTIIDFDAGRDSIHVNGVDGLNINDLVSDLTTTDKGVILHFNDNASVHLFGVSEEDLSVDDFVITE